MENLPTLAAPLPTNAVDIPPMRIGARGPLAIIAGPCVLENDTLPLEIAAEASRICSALGVPYIFKASFDKANRSSAASFRGTGRERGLEILAHVKETVGVPVLTDVHTPEDCAACAEVVDVLQIPAFLSRQTDLLIAAGETGKPINLKKGQWMAPWDMGQAVNKIAATGNEAILLCDRGTAFGYNTLISDMRGIAQMQSQHQRPVVFDAGHSVQQPGGMGDRSGGQRDMIPVLARAAVAAGCDAVFVEVHPDPDNAKSDGPNSFPLDQFEALVRQLKAIAELLRG